MVDAFKFFWHRGVKDFLINCENNGTPLAEITRKSSMQHAHVQNLAKKLEAINLIVRNEKKGRMRTTMLTVKGIEIRDLLKTIGEKLVQKEEELIKNGNGNNGGKQNGDTSQRNNNHNREGQETT